MVKNRRLHLKNVYNVYFSTYILVFFVGNNNLSAARTLGGADLSPDNSVGRFHSAYSSIGTGTSEFITGHNSRPFSRLYKTRQRHSSLY